MKALSFGSVNIDYVYRVPHFALPGETIQSLSLTRNLGGKGANQAIAAAKAGLHVYMAGAIGEDGRFLLPELSESGVDITHLDVRDTMTGNAMITVDPSGENSIVLFPGSNHEITDEQIERTLSSFGKGDMLILQNEISSMPEIIRRAHERGLYICFNPAPFTDAVMSYPAELVDLIVVNEIEGACLAGLPEGTAPEEIIASLRKRFGNTDILLTLGRDGSMYACHESGETLSQKAEKAVAVDTTAAGDTFIGYFLASRSRGYSIAESLGWASKASAITVSRPGAAKSIPLHDEVFGN